MELAVELLHDDAHAVTLLVALTKECFLAYHSLSEFEEPDAAAEWAFTSSAPVPSAESADTSHHAPRPRTTYLQTHGSDNSEEWVSYWLRVGYRNG